MSILNLLAAVSEPPKLTEFEKQKAHKVEYYRKLNQAIRLGEKPEVIRAKRPRGIVINT